MDISNLIQSLFGSPAPAPSPSIFVDDATRQRVTQDALSRARQLQGVPPALMPVSVPTNQQAQSQLASVPPDLVQRAQPKTYSLGSTEPGSLRYALGSMMGLHPPADNMLASQPAPKTAMLAQAEQPSPLAAAPAGNVTSMPLPATTLPAGAPPIDTNPMPPQTPQVAQSSDPWSGERQTDPWAGLRQVTAPNTDPVTTASTASPQAALSSAAAASPSLWDKYQNFTRSDRGRALNAFFTGLAMGKTPQESLAYGARMIAATAPQRQKRDVQNQTAKWLQSQGIDPNEASIMAANPPVLSKYLKQRFTPKPDDRTSDIKDYQFYVRQEKQAGRNPVSYNDWRIQGRRAGATNISDIGNTKGETTYDQTVGKNLGEKTVSIMDSGMQAANKIGTLQLLKEALGNVYQGTGGTSYQSLRRLGQSLGFKVDNVGDGDLAQSISRQMALQLRDPSNGAGMPGAMSNADREYLMSMVPGLSKTPQGNAHIIDYMIRIQQRNADVARMAREYMAQNNGRLDYKFFGNLDQWTKANPLFPSLPKGSGPAGDDGFSRVRNPAAPGANGPVRAVNPKTGQHLELQNGKWVPVQ